MTGGRITPGFGADEDLRMQAAFEELAKERQAFVREFLGGKKLVPKALPILRDSLFASGTARSVAGAGAETALMVAQPLVQKLLGVIPLYEFIQEITQSLWYEIVSQIGLYLGPAVDAAKAAYAWAKFGDDVYQWWKSHRKALRVTLSEDGVAALSGLKHLIRRTTYKNIYAGVKNTVTSAAQTGLLASGYGGAAVPAIGGAGAIADFIHRLVWIIVEFKEARAANKLLKNPADITTKVFNVCPLLGCYILTCSTRSNVLNWFADDMGADGWKADVEAMNKKLTGILPIATNLIYQARWEIKVPWLNPDEDPEKFGVIRPHYLPGQVIRFDGGGPGVKMNWVKQKVGNTVQAWVLHPQVSWRERKKRKEMKNREMEHLEAQTL